MMKERERGGATKGKETREGERYSEKIVEYKILAPRQCVSAIASVGNASVDNRSVSI